MGNCTSALSKLLCTPLLYIIAGYANLSESGVHTGFSNDLEIGNELDFNFVLCFDMSSLDSSSCGVEW